MAISIILLQVHAAREAHVDSREFRLALNPLAGPRTPSNTPAKSKPGRKVHEFQSFLPLHGSLKSTYTVFGEAAAHREDPRDLSIQVRAQIALVPTKHTSAHHKHSCPSSSQLCSRTISCTPICYSNSRSLPLVSEDVAAAYARANPYGPTDPAATTQEAKVIYLLECDPVGRNTGSDARRLPTTTG